MKTINEVMQIECKNCYDRIVQPNGQIHYYIWQPMSINESGIIKALGKHYQDSRIVASSNDLEYLYSEPIPNYDEDYYFVEDTAAWGKAHGIDSVEGLIGLPFHQFNIEANRRCKEEN